MDPIVALMVAAFTVLLAVGFVQRYRIRKRYGHHVREPIRSFAVREPEEHKADRTSAPPARGSDERRE